MRPSVIGRLFLLFALPLSLIACGHKGPVKPLEKAQPSAVQKLTVGQFGKSFRISWATPTVNQDGSPLQDLDHFEIYRMSYDLADDCPECRDTSSLIQTIDPNYPEKARKIEDRFYFFDRQNLEGGSGYQYRVVAVNRSGYGGTPAQKRTPYYLPPQPPTELTATGLDRLARLSWQEPAVPDGMTLKGYRIYRAKGEAPLAPRPLTSTPEPTTGYDDFDIVNGQTYRYGVRAVFETGATELETDFSNLTSATPGE